MQNETLIVAEWNCLLKLVLILCTGPELLSAVVKVWKKSFGREGEIQHWYKQHNFICKHLHSQQTQKEKSYNIRKLHKSWSTTICSYRQQKNVGFPGCPWETLVHLRALTLAQTNKINILSSGRGKKPVAPGLNNSWPEFLLGKHRFLCSISVTSSLDDLFPHGEIACRYGLFQQQTCIVIVRRAVFDWSVTRQQYMRIVSKKRQPQTSTWSWIVAFST